MKTTIKQKTVTEKEVEIDITFPAFRKTSLSIYKITDEHTLLSVSDNSIDMWSAAIPIGYGGETKQATEKEFNERFNEAILKLQNTVYPETKTLSDSIEKEAVNDVLPGISEGEKQAIEEMAKARYKRPTIGSDL